MIKRKLVKNILASCEDSPVLMLHGARQVGKSTLLKEFAKSMHPAEYISLDDAVYLSAAKSDPHGFIKGFEGNVVLDEIQLAPELLRAIKLEVDNDRKPGNYLLTGSANVLTVPGISESLAGRMELLNLYPFSLSEIENRDANTIKNLFERNITLGKKVDRREEINNRILRGGYPEAVSRKTDERRGTWFESYSETIIKRDIREISNIEGMNIIPKLLNILAARVGALVNFAELARSSAIPQTSLKRYLTLLESIFLIRFLPAYSKNKSKRLIKTPKIYFNDTGFVSHLLSLTSKRFESEKVATGFLLENYVLMELIKEASWSENRCRFYHYSTASAQEVDFIIENNLGEAIAIEVKSTHSPKAEMFNHMRALAEEIGNDLKYGYLLYLGDRVVPFGEKLFAVPIDFVL
ncbi:MAG: ATP-binding protein [Melioribacteraceae bacterium]|nr:ATP-binding protein [Melioribacteraceae bacterium]